MDNNNDALYLELAQAYIMQAFLDLSDEERSNFFVEASEVRRISNELKKSKYNFDTKVRLKRK